MIHLLLTSASFTPDQAHSEALALALLGLFGLGLIAGILFGRN